VEGFVGALVWTVDGALVGSAVEISDVGRLVGIVTLGAVVWTVVGWTVLGALVGMVTGISLVKGICVERVLEITLPKGVEISVVGTSETGTLVEIAVETGVPVDAGLVMPSDVGTLTTEVGTID
jgi:hypothetical protein